MLHSVGIECDLVMKAKHTPNTTATSFAILLPWLI